jgi:hypothetical protein
MEIVNTNVNRSSKHRKYGNISISYSDDPAYAQHLSFYQVPPTEEVTMEEFEDYGYSRLKGKFGTYRLLKTFQFSKKSRTQK